MAPSQAPEIDWISALLRSGMSLEKLEQHIPFVGALLKREQDVEALNRFDEKGGKFCWGTGERASATRLSSTQPQTAAEIVPSNDERLA